MKFEKIMSPNNKVAAYISGVDISDVIENAGNYLTFPVNTYVLFGKRPESWEVTYGFPDRFVAGLTPEMQRQLTLMFAYMNIEITDFFDKHTADPHIDDTVDELSKKLSSILQKLDHEIDLYNKLREFTVTYVPICDLSYAGTDPQDSEQLTFRYDDVVGVLTIVVLCKLLSPVFGMLAGYLLAISHADSKKKETPCVNILTGILEDNCMRLHEKLIHYIAHVIEQGIDDEITYAFNGFTPNTLAHRMYATLLVRSFVNIPLMSETSNIMIFIISIVKSSLGNKSSTMNKSRVAERVVKSDDDDDDNASQLDIDSTISSKPAGITAIIDAAIPFLIERFLTDEVNPDSATLKFNRQEYYEAYNYLEHSLFEPTASCVSLACGYFGPLLGGGKSVLYASISSFTKLITLLQMIMISQGYITAGHLLTAIRGKALDPSEVRVALRLRSKFSPAYSNCRDTYDSLSRAGVYWDQIVEEIVDDLSLYRYSYNTPPVIWNALIAKFNIDASVIHNHQSIDIPADIIQEFCRFIEGYIRGNEEC